MNPDPLFVVNSKSACKACGGGRRERKACQSCLGSGFTPINLNGLWSPSPGFLVCGGPSLRHMPFERLRERGVVSLAVNNVAAYAPVSAYCFGDPQTKFHHGIHLDPKCISFVPSGKLRKHIRAKLPDGSFRTLDRMLMDCPTVFGFSRKAVLFPKEFLTTTYAQWGRGGNQPEADQPFRCIETMLLGVRLMHYLGCPKVYMVGVDFEMTDDRQYCFDQSKAARNGRYKKVNAMLREIKPVLDADGFQIFNCNPKSKCDVFPFVSFDEALEECKGAVPDEPFDLGEWYNKGLEQQNRDKTPEMISVADLKKIQNEHKKNSVEKERKQT